jgi:hypothetical protein
MEWQACTTILYIAYEFLKKVYGSKRNTFEKIAVTSVNCLMLNRPFYNLLQ